MCGGQISMKGHQIHAEIYCNIPTTKNSIWDISDEIIAYN